MTAPECRACGYRFCRNGKRAFVFQRAVFNRSGVVAEFPEIACSARCVRQLVRGLR